VTTTPLLVPRIARSAAEYGHARVYAGTRLTPGDPAALTADPARLLAALRDACRTAIAEDRVDAIVIGGGPLAVAARALAAEMPVPLVEPVPAAVRLAVARAA
jgi:Asp/Glu/hydantoin racemase